jgi:DNA-binding transcriptional regulator YiaG
MPTHSQFLAWLESRRSAGEPLTSIARGFGVSATTVTLWLQGKRNPSRMALVLGGLLAERDTGNWPL